MNLAFDVIGLYLTEKDSTSNPSGMTSLSQNKLGT